jgi:hypothetical protein
MPIPMLPGLKATPTVVCWGSVRSAKRLLVGALAVDAFETPREFVWNDAALTPLPSTGETPWPEESLVLEAATVLVRSIAEAMRESPLLMIVREGTIESRAWNRLRPLIPCAALGESIRWQNAPPPSPSPAEDLLEKISPQGGVRILEQAVRLLRREGEL